MMKKPQTLEAVHTHTQVSFVDMESIYSIINQSTNGGKCLLNEQYYRK